MASATLTLLVTAIVFCLDAPALARHNFSMLRVNPEAGAPGGDVSVSGFSYPVNAKVSIRFNALDGPVLAELEPTSNQDISGTVRIPPDTPSGRYVLYAVQYDSGGKVNRIPGRGAVTVVGPGAVAAAGTTGLELEERPVALVKGHGPSGLELVFVAVGALAVAGVITLVMARLVMTRRPASATDGEA